jgi:hypothetical protein
VNEKKTLIYVLFLTIFINIGFAMSEKNKTQMSNLPKIKMLK